MNVISAWAATRNNTIKVRSSEDGVPTAIHIDQNELRFGGTELAATLLDLCTRARDRARAERRTALEDSGMDRDVLDRLGLPTAAAVADSENELLAVEAPPVTWMKIV